MLFIQFHTFSEIQNMFSLNYSYLSEIPCKQFSNLFIKYIMMNQPPEKYPFYPPADADVRFYEGTTLKVNPTSADKQAKTCPKCLYPIHSRVYLKPCYHYLCYECYSNNQRECEYCSMPIYEAVKLGDRDVIYSCDNECCKIFMNEQELEKHKNQHRLLKEAQKK